MPEGHPTLRSLASLATRWEPGSLDAATIRACRVAALGYAHLPDGSPLRRELRSDAARAIARHESIKREFQGLLRAWNEAGIVPLLLKGFYLNEFAYRTPGLRWYGDIDVILERETVPLAVLVAGRAGWMNTEGITDTLISNPKTLGHLRSPSGITEIDLHVRLVHSRLLWTRQPDRITAAALAAARPAA